MNKKIIVSLILILVIVLFLTILEDKTSIVQQQQTEKLESIQAPLPRPTFPAQSHTRPEKNKSYITNEEIKKFRSLLPLESDAKSEISQNPHKTPASLVTFASMMGKLMNKAYSNLDDAYLLIAELHECVLREGAAEPAKALCLSHARKLSKTYPQLTYEVEEIEEQIPSRILKLLERRSKLMKMKKE